MKASYWSSTDVLIHTSGSTKYTVHDLHTVYNNFNSGQNFILWKIEII